ncbi:GH36-type glycosyl hydrolase domain-containing protein [Phenylobacterium soli]|uniref:GH36-type glycosyl hydrolase domain-containing protein n=1 Tax=Phenylobacterium soli TaxID=2170551 RepID=UPI001D04C195|nr:glucoamylase family protein [Phenylobacterium soli]
MDFSFLLDPDRKLLSIGYRPAESERDENCYDLLASEARLASFVAIAKGDVPARHWFHLGHAVTALPNGAALISWSGSMFEYLMPELVMRTPPGSLLDRTNHAVVRRQIAYGAGLGAPWGVSESAFNARDLELTYQYSNFGVPGLGLKRGLGDNAVIAPYATALAAMLEPKAAVRNFARLAGLGAQGRYGYYEALDYTPARVPDGKAPAIVRAFMAHHQGMTIVALADTVLDGLMRARFHAEPMVQATELLLQERMPREVAAPPQWSADGTAPVRLHQIAPPVGRRLASPHGPTPATHLLSNCRYTAMLTVAGAGFSRWQGQAVTRWREDATCDDAGVFVYLRDVRSGAVWSAGLQPTRAEAEAYEVVLNEDRAEITRRDGDLTTVLDVLVSAEDDAEVRRVSITNAGEAAREIEITSYVELALAPAAADLAHPAFSKLFVETEFVAGTNALLAHRRRRAPDEPQVWAAHPAVLEGEGMGKLELETDRMRFVGRGRDLSAPAAVVEGRPLTGSTGAVLDPIFALRRRVRIAPGATVRIAFWTMVAASREAVLDLVDKHHDVAAYDRAAALAWTQAQVQLRHLGLSAGEAGQFQRLAGYLIYAAPTLRPPSEVIAAGAGAQAGLWSLGISGDLPIALLRISDPERLDVARDLLRAAELWRLKGLAVDVVVLNERSSSYVQDLQAALEDLVRTSRQELPGEAPPGGVFIVRADLTPEATRALLMSVARVVLVAERGGLIEQLDRIPEGRGDEGVAPWRVADRAAPFPPPRPPALEFFNGLGGFAEGGREYVTVLGPGQTTPAPWINVVANPRFGFQVSAEGSGYVWSGSSREHQLTPWSNDPVTDRPGHALYLRDEDTGEVFSPTATPIRDEGATYLARHGFGYSRFEASLRGLDLSLLEYAPLADPVKISRLRIHNTSPHRRRLSATAYVEWVLGPSRARAAPFTVTEMDAHTGALFARNRWAADFAARVAFLDLGGRQTAWTGDRREFLGRNGTLAQPEALFATTPLSARVGAGLDPCGVLQSTIELEPGETADVVVVLGEAENEVEARRLVARYRAADLDAVLEEVRGFWADLLGKVQIETPDRALDVMANGWLLYQTLACRLWARSAFYQASGAYGFRDQLQDAMALASVWPALTREHLLRAAGRQFPEGDVQHWWLPHTGQGVRTRISDDRLWLAHCAAHYVRVTADDAVLDEAVPFLEGPSLAEQEHEAFFQPRTADEAASLYEHCARALDASLTLGRHGLPLIGAGDWNDGMNRVGRGGQGESVWLGWFLHATLSAFVPLAKVRGDRTRAQSWAAALSVLGESLEREAWDGDWYRRAWFDDGTPLGSASNDECRIDSVAQSWAVLSGAADPARAARAMAAVERELISPETGLALLFAPPFDQTARDPGYIKGYPPGVRENGGQYTHAALWAAIAFAKLGEGDKAADLLALLNPINHARTRAEAHRYKVEPYVVAADVYSLPPHVGRGGWTWYTGAAGWMQRAILEHLLGLRREGEGLLIDPCIPKAWPGFKAVFHHGTTRYEIAVENPDGVCRGVAHADCDGVPIEGRPVRLHLLQDGQGHHVAVRLGPAPARQIA